jgi:hypothetical protein
MRPSLRSLRVRSLAAGIWLAGAGCVHAQGSLRASYTISMTSVTIGHVTWSVEIGKRLYTATASGKTGGILAFLVNGAGGVMTQGIIADGHLQPTDFISHIVDEDGDTELHIAFDNGFAREQILHGKPPEADTVPITDADRRGVADPLSAVLISKTASDGWLAPANCNHRLKIFDGRRRYDFDLSYKRSARMTSAEGFAGAALVCGAVLRPLAGYRSGSLLVKYVANRHDMELWFAPIKDTNVLAPIRVLIPTVLGTLKIEAQSFSTAGPSEQP